MATEAVKITRKGQVTIPKRIRERLKVTDVYFEVVNDEAVVRAVKDATGSLSEYAGNVKPDISIKQMKDGVWEEAMLEKASRSGYVHSAEAPCPQKSDDDTPVCAPSR